MWGATHDSEDFVLTIAGACSSPPGKERRISGAIARIAQMPSTNPSSSVIVDQLTRALGEAVIRIWSNLPQEVQDHLFKDRNLVTQVQWWNDQREQMRAWTAELVARTLRGLAVTTAARSPALPDLAPVGDFVAGYEASSWHGIGVPKNTPADIVQKLNSEMNAVLGDPKVIARLAEIGGVPLPMTPVQFGQFVADETEKWAKVVKFVGIKPE